MSRNVCPKHPEALRKSTNISRERNSSMGVSAIKRSASANGSGCSTFKSTNSGNLMPSRKVSHSIWG